MSVPAAVSYLYQGAVRPASPSTRPRRTCPFWDCGRRWPLVRCGRRYARRADIVAVVSHRGVDRRSSRPTRRLSAARSGWRACRSPSSASARRVTRARSISGSSPTSGCRSRRCRLGRPAAGARAEAAWRRRFFVKARLRDGVTVAQARAAMDILGCRLAADYPNEDPGKGITVMASSDVRVHPQMDGLLDGARVGAARRRRSRAGDRLQQSGDAAARARQPPAPRKCPCGWRSARPAAS